MKRSPFIVVAAFGLSLAFLFSGCEKQEPVKPLKRPEDVAKDNGERRKRPRRTVRDDGRKPARVDKPGMMPIAQPETPFAVFTPQPAFQAGYPHVPVVLGVKDMQFQNGKPDKEDGWILQRNGTITSGPVKVDFMTNKVTLELKGTPANGIWPEVDLNMYNITEKMNYFPMQRTFITTSSYHLYEVPISPQLRPGEFLITLRYYNDGGNAEKKESRDLYFRSMTLHPFLVK